MLLYFELSSNKNETIIKKFPNLKKIAIHISNLEMLLDCILVFVGLQYKGSIVLHNIVITKADHLSKKQKAVRVRCFQSFYIYH